MMQELNKITSFGIVDADTKPLLMPTILENTFLCIGYCFKET